MHMLACRRS